MNSSDPTAKRLPRLTKKPASAPNRALSKMTKPGAPSGSKIRVHKTKPVSIQVTPGKWQENLKDLSDTFKKRGK